jgi:hypothetical protein
VEIQTPTLEQSQATVAGTSGIPPCDCASEAAEAFGSCCCYWSAVAYSW